MRDVLLGLFGLIELVIRFIVVVLLTVVSIGLIWLILDLEPVLTPVLWGKIQS